MKKIFALVGTVILLAVTGSAAFAREGYKLWLRYERVSNLQRLREYRESISAFLVEGNSPTMNAAKHELRLGLRSMLGEGISETDKLNRSGVLVVGRYGTSSLLSRLDLHSKVEKVGSEGFVILSGSIQGKKVIAITGNTDIGVLYGVFRFLMMMEQDKDIANLDVVSYPRIRLRMLDHWDNLNGTVERGYAGFSIWDWHTLPIYIKPRYIDYARANAAIGINGTVLNNVNADPRILTHHYLVKVAALADVFRPYGIKVYLCANFDAPILLGELKTANPLDKQVQKWWDDKAKEIYSLIPDFGGFLVKANSEGQPGPSDYGLTQADGANLLARALKPYEGIVMWRAFVYTYNAKDRAKQAYNIFKPLDGKFDDNVLLQIKNGPLDFQPREPFSPLFGAMPKTNLIMEFQITMEYLGQGTSTVFLAPLFRETLNSDTYAKGKGSTVAKVIDGKLDGNTLTGMAGVSNIGADRDWTGNIFGQSSWYAFGRLAWNPNLTSKEIADEWIRMTFSNKRDVVDPVDGMMLQSRENVVNYMDPLGLNMIFGYNNHYGPGPWVDFSPHPDWNSTYYHRADSAGIGFDRTSTGSDAVSQYFPPVADSLASLKTCPDRLLLWFHHVPWNYRLKTDNTLWDQMCYDYQAGVDSVREMQKTWNSLKGKIDNEEWNNERMLLEIQEHEAVWWRNACLLYFQTFSKMPFPEGIGKPDHTLKYYESLNFPNAPGTW